MDAEDETGPPPEGNTGDRAREELSGRLAREAQRSMTT